MSSKFQRANELAILAIGRRITYEAEGVFDSDAVTSPPASDGDGLNLRGSVKAILSVKTDTGETGEIRVWLYTGNSGATPPEGRGWCVARNGVLAVDEFGLTERLDVAGYQRIYIEWSTAPATAVNAVVGRAVLE
jgi:hypothetical protein